MSPSLAPLGLLICSIASSKARGTDRARQNLGLALVFTTSSRQTPPSLPTHFEKTAECFFNNLDNKTRSSCTCVTPSCFQSNLILCNQFLQNNVGPAPSTTYIEWIPWYFLQTARSPASPRIPEVQLFNRKLGFFNASS